MTVELRDQIMKLSAEGDGYRTIAAKLNLTVDKVRYHCRTNGLNGRAKDLLIFDGVTCPTCGGPIEQITGKGRRRKFCCEKCRREWWNKHPGAGNKKETAFYTSTCACCNKEFKTYGNNHRTYCSRDCYIKARFWT